MIRKDDFPLWEVHILEKKKKEKKKRKNNFRPNLVKLTLRVPVGQSVREWYHCSCLFLGYIIASTKSSIREVQYSNDVEDKINELNLKKN